MFPQFTSVLQIELLAAILMGFLLGHLNFKSRHPVSNVYKMCMCVKISRGKGEY